MGFRIGGVVDFWIVEGIFYVYRWKRWGYRVRDEDECGCKNGLERGEGVEFVGNYI